MKALTISLIDLAAFITLGGIAGIVFLIAITIDNLKIQ
jgi:hypothetical protein